MFDLFVLSFFFFFDVNVISFCVISLNEGRFRVDFLILEARALLHGTYCQMRDLMFF